VIGLQKKITHFLDKVQPWKQYQKKITHNLAKVPSGSNDRVAKAITHRLNEIPSGTQL
jgi:hypothetical protein